MNSAYKSLSWESTLLSWESTLLSQANTEWEQQDVSNSVSLSYRGTIQNENLEAMPNSAA